MADNNDKDKDPLEGNWLSGWEEQTLDEWESERASMDDRISVENERAAQKLWLSFQNSASSISQLYKEGSHQNKVSMWVPFQNSASSVTNMYKDGLDVMKRCFELGKQYGHYKRQEELVSWIRKHRRHIRREELVGYLSGKPPPRHKPTSTLSRSSSRTNVDRSSPRIQSPRLPSATEVTDKVDDLQPFRDALALQGLNGAMSNFGICHGGANASSTDGNTNSSSNYEDIHGFILDEMSRRCLTDSSRKRSSSNDSTKGMDSPTRKRSRLL